MTDQPSTQPPGWYYAQGDPPGTQRYWDGTQWQGAPQAVPGAGGAAAVDSGPAVASAGLRIVARVVDIIIYAVVSSIIVAVAGGGTSVGLGQDLSGGFVVGTLIATAVVCGLEIYLVANGGQSLGKKLFGIKVVKVDGSDVDMETSVKRFALYILSSLANVVPVLGAIISLVVLLVGIVSFVFLFTDDMRQTVWDKFAETKVVKA